MGNVLTFLLLLPKSILHLGDQEEGSIRFFSSCIFRTTHRGGDNRRGGILCAGNSGAWKKGGKPEGKGEEKNSGKACMRESLPKNKREKEREGNISSCTYLCDRSNGEAMTLPPFPR